MRSTATRHRATVTGVMGPAEICNDPVDRLPTLRAAGGTNPQQASKLLRAARVELYARRASGKRRLCV